MRNFLRVPVFLLGISFVIPSFAGCPTESLLTYGTSKGLEISSPLTALQVEALTQTGPNGMSGPKPYGPTNPDWQELKSKQRIGDYFVQFWRGKDLTRLRLRPTSDTGVHAAAGASV